VAEIKIGTSGYSYKEWVGAVYPEGTKQGDFLKMYAGMFPTVELNFSFYKMPEAKNLSKMLVDGGDELSYSIKAHKTLTHEINLSEWENEAKKYTSAIEPLLQEGRLETVLFQFPYSFHYEDDNRRYLGKLLNYFKDIPMAVEFRGADWYIARVIDSMRDRKISLVSLDMPDLPKLPPSMDVVTSDTAYIRLHGRNKEAWWGKDAHAQYDYEYSDLEIDAWAGRIEGIAEQAQRILVYFNNHPQGKAARNAHTLEKLLRKMGLIAEDGGNHGGAFNLSS
jgi:uncharacterized protein YecE (DUF72 family)